MTLKVGKNAITNLVSYGIFYLVKIQTEKKVEMTDEQKEILKARLRKQ